MEGAEDESPVIHSHLHRNKPLALSFLRYRGSSSEWPISIFLNIRRGFSGSQRIFVGKRFCAQYFPQLFCPTGIISFQRWIFLKARIFPPTCGGEPI
jgi:hypothetical protein